MAESQNIEWKESWRDEYLKWICGFANAQGGKIYIGLKDDGRVIGVKNSKKLLEDIPNKIRNTMGIVADVNLHEKDGLEYLEIIVSPSSFPVSYYGEFHYRSGSTKQLLTGIALSDFIMKRAGVHWEDAIVEGITMDDIDDESIKIFKREARRCKRMKPEDLNVSTEELLEKLHLSENGKLKRSAVLLFTNKCEMVQTGSYTKVGHFGIGSDLQYQDLFEGSLINTADKIIDVIYLKYLKAAITYDHDRRVETYPYARDAIREAIYNALVHNCYMFGSPIQIRISDEEMRISNSCILPSGWTLETLLGPHTSEPYNPNIARVFYLAGYIETWGRGVEKIFETCEELGAPKPEYSILGNGVTVRFPALQVASTDSKTSNRQNGGLDGGLDDALDKRILSEIRSNPSLTQKELSDITNIPLRTIQRKLREMQDAGLIQRVGGKRFGHWEIL